MGALAGALAGIGQRMHEENVQNQAAQLATNEHMAQFFEDQSKNAKTPEDQIALMQKATQYRGLGIKKPGKDLDPYTIMNERYQKEAAAHMAALKQAQQNPGPAGPTGNGGIAPAPPQSQLPAPAPDATQMQGGGMASQGQQVPSGVSGIASRITPSFDQGAAAPQPQAAPAPKIPQVIPGVSVQPGSDNPPPMSGLPSPGFTTVAQANTPQHHDFWRSPEEQQEFTARGAGLTAGATAEAQRKAELAKLEGETAFKIKSERGEIDQRIKDLQGEIDPRTGKSAWDVLTPRQKAEVRIGAKNVTPEIRPQMIPGATSNADILREDPTASYVSPDGRVTPLDPKGFSRTRIGSEGRSYEPSTPMSLIAPKAYDLQGGGKGIASASDIASGGAPTPIPGAVGSAAPVTSTQTSPGAAPITTVRRKGSGGVVPTGGGVGASLPSPRPANGSSGAPTPQMGPVERSMPAGLRMQADRVQSGDIQPPAGRDGAAINNIIAERVANQTSQGIPTQYSKATTDALTASGAVLDQIKRIKAELEPLKNDKTWAYFAKDYAKYRAGLSSDSTAALISDLSMAGILGAGRVLAAEKIRTSLPLYNEAAKHTPNLLLDSPNEAYVKLSQMQKNIEDGNAEAIKYGRKSGVPQSLPAAGLTPAAPPAGADPDDLRRFIKH